MKRPVTEQEYTLRCPAVHSARDVPKLRVWCEEQWHRDGLFWQAATLAKMRRNAAFPAVVNDALGSFDERDRADIYARWERNTLRDAQLWWVSAEMEMLLLAAAKSVPDDVTVHDVPQPDPCGFAVFERSMFGTSADSGDPIDVRAIAWGPNLLPPLTDADVEAYLAAEGSADDPRMQVGWNPGYSISSYSMLDLDAGMTPEQMMANGPGIAELMDERGRIVDEDVPTRVIAHGQIWTTCGRSDWLTGTTVTDRALFGDYVDPWVSAVEDRKLLVAFWTLVHQAGIAETRVERPPRPEVRRVQRAGYEKSAADVRVVRLRRVDRSEPGEPTGEKRHYSHRFIVGGHWRNQACGPNRSERKLIWIHPYVKGEGDFVQPETVRAWVR